MCDKRTTSEEKGRIATVNQVNRMSVRVLNGDRKLLEVSPPHLKTISLVVLSPTARYLCVGNESG